MKKSLLALFLLLNLLYAQTTNQSSNNLVEEGKKYLNNLKFDKAIELFNKACNMKNAKGCYFLGFIYNGRKGKPDLALKYYKKACKLGDAFSCVNAGMILKKNKDYKNAVNFFNRAIKLNDKNINGLAYLNLGKMYEDGLGVKKDLKKAEKLYKTGCDKHHNAFSCRFLTNLYKSNILKYYKKMCDMKYNYINMSVPGEACYKLGQMYEYGVLLQRDIKKAKEYYKKGCEKNDGNSCENLAGLYYNEDNYKEAFKYYVKACDDDLVQSACYNVGLMYYYGIGTNKSYKEAAIYLDGSCEDGYPKSCKIYKKLKASGY